MFPTELSDRYAASQAMLLPLVMEWPWLILLSTVTQGTADCRTGCVGPLTCPAPLVNVSVPYHKARFLTFYLLIKVGSL
jgi:hypothetical protein